MSVSVLPVNYDLLTPTQRRSVREQYRIQQGGLCYHCGAALDGPAAEHVAEKIISGKLFPAGFFDYPVHLHHCHKTGMTIGAVHSYCNAVLWQYHGE